MTFQTKDLTLSSVDELHSSMRARRSAILERLTRQEHVSTNELSEEFGVSRVTIRADLEALEVHGRLRRVHGGAVRLNLVVETRHDSRRSIDKVAKRRMAAEARQMIEPGMTVVLDAGTSTLALAELLAGDETISEITVVTNGLPIATALEPGLNRMTVFLTGGSLRAMQRSLVNPGVSETLDRLKSSIAFIGCDGIHCEHGVTTTNFPEADVKERMRETSEQAVLLTAGSKVGEVATIKVNDARAFDTLVTTSDADSATVNQLEALGLEIRMVKETATSNDRPNLHEKV